MEKDLILNCKLEYEIISGNGKGKEYYNNGKLEFEGEYLNGERNGKGKEYDDCGRLRFEGEYLNGERNEKIKEYYQKKLDETERQKFYKIFNEQPVRRGRRGGFRGRRGGFIGRRDLGFRGRRGGFRGRRDLGFRGRRGFGFRARGFRGGNRGRPFRVNRPRGM